MPAVMCSCLMQFILFGRVGGKYRTTITSPKLCVDFKITLPLVFMRSSSKIGREARAFFSAARW
jgi:hypothetical protein